MVKNGKQPVTRNELRTELKKLESKLVRIVDQKMAGRFSDQDKKIDAQFLVQDKKIDAKLSGLEQKIDGKFRMQNETLSLRIAFEVEQKVKAAEERLHQHFDQAITKLDPLLGEIRTARQERAFMSARLTDHGDRLEKLESVVVDKAAVTDSK